MHLKTEQNPTQQAKVLAPTAESIQICAQALQRSEVVGMPTETVYGLAGNGLSPLALSRIFETKERPTFDPLILHVSEEDRTIERLQARQLIDSSKMNAFQIALSEHLMKTFWPGPLTLVLPKHPNVPDLATSGLPTVAIRMPKHPIAQKLIQAAQVPLAAPSANRFGRISPTSAQAVNEELGDRIHWILDGGSCSIGVESTIVKIDSHQMSILRPGGLSREDLDTALKAFGIQCHTHSGHPKAPIAPGMLDSHYAPSKPLKILPKSLNSLNDAELKNHCSGGNPSAPIGILLFSGDPESLRPHIESRLQRPVVLKTLCRNLDATGDLKEAAQNFFSTLRELDASDAQALVAEPCPTQKGLGYALMDRLRRASAQG